MRSLGNFIKGLKILSKYMEKGMDEFSFCTATHDQIWFFAYGNVSDDDFVKLESLGFFEDENDGWSYNP